MKHIRRHVIAVTLFWFAISLAAHADDLTITTQPSPLSLSGKPAQAFSAPEITLVAPVEISNLTLSASDLVPSGDTTGKNALKSAFTIEPASFAKIGPQKPGKITLKFNPIPNAGVYEGRVNFAASAGTTVAPVKFTLTIKAPPDATAGNASGGTPGATLLSSPIALALPASISLNPSDRQEKRFELTLSTLDKSVTKGDLYYIETADTASATLRLPAGNVTPAPVTAPASSAGNADVSTSLSAPPISKKEVMATPLVADVPLSVNKLTHIPIFINQQDLAPGRYGGTLYLLIPDHAPVTVPISMTIRAFWVWPLILLLIGSGLSILLAWYRSAILPRDQLLARIGQLQLRIVQEPAFHSAANAPNSPAVGQVFADRLTDRLRLAQDQVTRSLTADATTTLAEADTLYARWIRFRTDWIAQLTHLQDLRGRIQGIRPTLAVTVADSIYLATLLQNLDAAEKKAPDDPDAQPLSGAIAEGVKGLNDYRNLDARLAILAGLLNEVEKMNLTEEQKKPVAGIEDKTYRRQLESLDPKTKDTPPAAGGSSPFAALQKAVEEDIKTLQNFIKGINAGFAAPPPGAFRRDFPAPPGLSGAVTAGSRAQSRINLFFGVSYAVAIVLLVCAGFNQLYWQNLTFGANPMDYPALVAWGFGAETLTRAAVSGAVNGFNLPGLTASAPSTH